MADPTKILQLIATLRLYIDTYGGYLLSILRRGFVLLVYALMHLPGWIAQVWDFIEQVVDAIRTGLGI